MIEEVLGVGRRRAQQILAPCITDRVGSSGLGDRRQVIARLRQLAEGEDGRYERRRRRRLGAVLSKLNEEFVSRPRVLVEAPARIAARGIDELPEGILLETGRITVSFGDPREALEKLLALAMAIGNDYDWFERATASDNPRSQRGDLLP